MAALETALEGCLQRRQPVYAVVSVIGSTEESAVDPLVDLLVLRNRFRARGLDFVIHADAAWGGYLASLIREDEPGTPPPTKPIAAVPLSAYVAQQFEALQHTDSITVDPHKSGYIPYPAGALCYRNGAMRDMVTFKAPVIAHGDAEPTMGIYGIEGSKPGAAAAAVYLSHKVIRPTKSGYGRIHGQALFSCKRLYARLVSMAFRFVVVVPVPRLPAERNGEDATAQLQFIRERIDRRSNEEILADPEALSLLQELGPDQNILAYAFNLRDLDGRLNPNLTRTNRLAVDPTLSLSYFNPKTGAEMSSSLGVTFNVTNKATDYKTADEFHLETTLAQHFKSNFIVGVTGYYYQQLGNDSGAGARSFQHIVGAESLQARVFGVGPVAQYSTKIEDVGVSFQGKFLHEFGALRRLESDIYWATLSFAF
jgi:hypothetical protein